jgi:sigma-B regulation protein RsbU (phosphoserine phosphatase)
VCLGDVSGKGLPASLLMANLQATLRGQTALDSPVGETISRSNRLIYQSTDPEKFATLFIAVMDMDAHTLSFCNAGHENPILLRADGGVDRLATGGMALGVLEDFPYESGDERMGPGDVLVIYSDGIPDAVNEFEHPFGEERLIACLRECAAEPAAEILRRVVTAVREHEQGAERIDDLTIVVVKRTS